MNVLVDTSVWSFALRRRRKTSSPYDSELRELIEEGRAGLIGPVRQELLSGVKDRAHFVALRDHLRAFPDLPITSGDYEQAAMFFNACRERGIQGSNTDFLLCAVSRSQDLAIFTVDDDFKHYGRILPIRLHTARKKAR